jgi:excisionase family DNA binding protein
MTSTTMSATNGLTIRDAARRIGVSSRTVGKLLQRRQLRFYKVGRLTRITDEAIDEFIERSERPAVADGERSQ